MKAFPTRFMLLLAFALAAQGVARGQGQAVEPLSVAVVGNAPFVIKADPPIGLSVDVWETVAASLGVAYTLVPQEDIDAAISGVEAGEFDIAVGPVSITASRAERVTFAQPYFNASLAIMAPQSGSLYDRFAPFFTRTFVTGFSALAAVLILIGTLLWLAERRANPEQFPQNPRAGIANGVWMALVTMTTVGYGDRVPVSVAGRVISGIWMFIGLVIASSLTAFLATALTLSQMDGPSIETAEQLRGRRVAVVGGTTSEEFVESVGGRALAAPDVQAAVVLLERGDADAVVFDRPMLRYIISEDPSLDFRISASEYRRQNYGFAVPKGNPLGERIGLEILRLRESGELLEIEQRWLGAR